MTKKDFELIAEAIGVVESDYKGLHRAIFEEIAEELAKRIAPTHPRFKPELFKMACTPFKHEELRDEIIANLNQN